MPSRSRPIALLLALLLAPGCSEDSDASGTVEPGDEDGGVEVLLPDTQPAETTVEPPDTQPAEDLGPCPGCTGSACEENGDCNSGYCLEGPDGKECVRTCSDECPTGYACRGVQDAGGDPVFLCLYSHIAYCQPCDADGDCETGIGGLSGARCLPNGDDDGSDGRFCRTPCTPGSCPDGATCEEVTANGQTALLCRPGGPNTPGECTCSARAAALALTTTCSLENELGTCFGIRGCDAEGPVSECDALSAAAEACNDLDDDCDGETDEDFPLRGEACDGDDEDGCTGGIYICGDDGALICTDDDNSELERCDGVDNDCDGETDEGFEDLGAACDGPDVDTCDDGVFVCDGLSLVCDDGPETDTSGEELCNGVDDNCNIEVDEGFEDKNQPCDGDDEDGCKDGFFLCSPDGLSLVCNDDAASHVELCNELDDDCQNGPDDTFPDKLQPCDGPDDDACPDGIWVCGPDQTTLACTDDGVSRIEVCNDLDDDCDGDTDEDFELKGSACDSEVDIDDCEDGEWVCSDNTLVCNDDADSITETCNGVDDDCDGATDSADEDLADELNPNQLGACAGSVMSCQGEAGYVADYSSVPTYDQPETPDDLFFDENCDGLDGDEARAVFVAPGGSDSSGCPKSAPCGSVAYAVGQTSASRNHVYVQAGTYTGVVDIPSGANVEIYGGFDSGWERAARTELGHKVTLKGAKHQGDGEYVAVRARSATVKLADLVIQAASPQSEERKNGQGLSSYAVHAVSSQVTLERVEVLQGNGASGADGSPGSDAPSLTAPSKAGKGGNATQAVDICDDDSMGSGASGQGNGQCSNGTKGGQGGDGGTMDQGCSCLGLCWDQGISGFCSNQCPATNGTKGGDGSGDEGGDGGSRGLGGSSCSGVGAGDPGETPSHGTGGAGGGRGGSLVTNYWYGGDGGIGTLGAHGSGGGGGGGSGGCDESEVPLQNSSGAGGGGGGAGGCRAESGGGGGKAGGSSFGVLAVGGTVTARSTRFVLGNGGAGGRGGPGGLGQPGGPGGDGGNAAGSSQAGGAGGKGGDGGASGGGGGGAGGNSYGVYTQGATVDVDASNDLGGGSAGTRGEGGDAAAVAGSNGDGKPGQAGRIEAIWTCASAGACGD